MAKKRGDDFVARLRRELPRLLRERTDVRAEVVLLLADSFTTREETNRILVELRLQREAIIKLGEETRALREQFEKNVIHFNQRTDEMVRRMDDLNHWVGVVVGGFQRRAGRSLEDAVAGTLRFALNISDISPDQVKLREKIVDTDGIIGPAGRTYEFDLLVHNGDAYVFEVKSVAEVEHAERIALKAKLVATQLGRTVEPVLVALDRPEDVQAACREHGVRLV